MHDVFDLDALNKHLESGMLRRQPHPNQSYAILNYTQACQYAGVWDFITLSCRGLVYDPYTGEIVARGFGKFFNHGQPGAPTIGLDDSVLVTDKHDGSLGIIVPGRDGRAPFVATRGSFVSEQAVHATMLLNIRHRTFRPPEGITALVEIVYPGNRIVVDYAEMDDLILIGGQPLDGSRPIPSATMAALTGWSGPVAETLHVGSFAEALALPTRPNAEGVVVHNLNTGDMVKIKYEEYVRLHKLVSGLNARTVWEHLSVHDRSGLDDPLAALVDTLPDEFHDWVRQVGAGLRDRYDEIESVTWQDYFHLCQVVFGVDDTGDILMPVPGTAVDRDQRKRFAALAVTCTRSSLLFLLLDGRSITTAIWQEIRPEASTPTGTTHTEETA